MAVSDEHGTGGILLWWTRPTVAIVDGRFGGRWSLLCRHHVHDCAFWRLGTMHGHARGAIGAHFVANTVAVKSLAQDGHGCDKGARQALGVGSQTCHSRQDCHDAVVGIRSGTQYGQSNAIIATAATWTTAVTRRIQSTRTIAIINIIIIIIKASRTTATATKEKV